MLEILKEVTHAIINNPITCLVFYFCIVAQLVCCVAGCVLMLLDSFCELNCKKKLKKKNKTEPEALDFNFFD